MFTGIVSDIGEVLQLEPTGDLRARIGTAYDLAQIATGASIACDGVCLTVVATGVEPQNWFEVQISGETLAKSTLGTWQAGSRINLERALRVGDELGGHIVSGHVDGLAEVLAIREEGESTRVTFRAPHALGGFIAPKGSVTLNGTSLTVNEVADTAAGTEFGINLIPHTKTATTWGGTAVGDRVNLEIDTMARYVARLRDWAAE